MLNELDKLGAPDRESNALDAVEFVRLLDSVQQAEVSGDWLGAAGQLERLARSNPVDARLWRRLGDALARTERWDAAIAAFECALTLGQEFPFDVVYDIAVCHARAGRNHEALAALRRAFELGFREYDRPCSDSAFTSLHSDQQFREIVGIPPVGLDRDGGWRFDLAHFAREVKRRAHAPFRLMTEETFDARIGEIERNIAQCDDLTIMLELQKVLVLLGDGHAGISRADEFSSIVPVVFEWFEEGIFVTWAGAQARPALGCQLLAIDDVPVAEIAKRLDPYICRDNEYWPLHVIPYRLREPRTLSAIGIAQRDDRLRLRLRDSHDETFELELRSETHDASELMRRATPVPDGWTGIHEQLGIDPPISIKRRRESFWFDDLPGNSIVFAQINRTRNEPEETLPEFAERLLRHIDSRTDPALVLDLRWNGGGNTYLTMPLLHGLIGHKKINQRGRLFVMAGRHTFSAAQNLTTLIERHTAATIVGEPSGSRPNFIGETIEFSLPCSGARVNVSDLFWQSSWPTDVRPWVTPTIYEPPTIAAYRAGQDRALEAIVDLVASHVLEVESERVD